MATEPNAPTSKTTRYWQDPDKHWHLIEIVLPKEWIDAADDDPDWKDQPNG